MTGEPTCSVCEEPALQIPSGGYDDEGKLNRSPVCPTSACDHDGWSHRFLEAPCVKCGAAPDPTPLTNKQRKKQAAKAAAEVPPPSLDQALTKLEQAVSKRPIKKRLGPAETTYPLPPVSTKPMMGKYGPVGVVVGEWTAISGRSSVIKKPEGLLDTNLNPMQRQLLKDRLRDIEKEKRSRKK